MGPTHRISSMMMRLMSSLWPLWRGVHCHKTRLLIALSSSPVRDSDGLDTASEKTVNKNMRGMASLDSIGSQIFMEMIEGQLLSSETVRLTLNAC